MHRILHSLKKEADTLKKFVGFIVFTFIVIVLTTTFANATVYDFTVTANPLWTDTGIALDPNNEVHIWGATGTWSWGVTWGSGPDGSYDPTEVWDEYI